MTFLSQVGCHAPHLYLTHGQRLIVLITVMKTMLVQIFTRFKTTEDTSTQGSFQMAEIRFERLPPCNRGKSMESGSQRPSKIALITPEESSQCISTSEGASQVSSRLDSLSPSSNSNIPSMARVETEANKREPEAKADVEVQPRQPPPRMNSGSLPGRCQPVLISRPNTPALNTRYTRMCSRTDA